MQRGKQIPLKRDYPLMPMHADVFGRLKFSRFLLDMQDIADNHAELLGVGHSALSERGIAWVLTRVRMDIHRMPQIGESLRLSTWANMPQKLLFPRFFLLEDAYGRECVTVSTVWVLIEMDKRRILSPQRAGVLMPTLEEDIEPYAMPEKLQNALPLLERFEREASYSDFDLNRHMNNTRYLEWLYDVFSLEFHEEHILRRIQMNYLHEIADNQPKKLDVYGEGDEYCFQISGADRVCFEAFCRFEQAQ